MARWFLLTVTVAIVAVGFVLFYERDTFDPVSIRGKRVLVTGASSGIGEELAYHYSKFGASLVITARREDLLRKVAAKCKELGAQKVEYVVADMEKPEERLKVVSDTEKHLAGLDHLILNHALMLKGALWLGTEQNFTLLNAHWQINFVSFVDIASKCLKMLSDSKGNIGVVSSGAGKSATPTFSSYSAGKHALQGFFSSYRQELRFRGIDVSVTICVLGYIGTEKANEIIKEWREVMPYKAAAVDDTAMAIIKGVTKRSYEIYTPFSTQFTFLLYKFIPEYFDVRIGDVLFSGL